MTITADALKPRATEVASTPPITREVRRGLIRELHHPSFSHACTAAARRGWDLPPRALPYDAAMHKRWRDFWLALVEYEHAQVIGLPYHSRTQPTPPSGSGGGE